MEKLLVLLRTFSSSAIVGFAIGALVVGAGVFAAFQPPTTAPPGGNVGAPINVGPNGQTKLGGITLNASLIPAPDGLIVKNGYTQLALYSGTSLPPGTDCDAADERGRMKVNNVLGVLYVCVDSGWVAK